MITVLVTCSCLTTNNSEPRATYVADDLGGIASDASGNIWFVESYDSAIGEISPTDGIINRYAGLAAYLYPGGITIDSKNNLWFTEGTGSNIGEISPPSKSAKEYPIPGNSNDHDFTNVIITGTNGIVWFLEPDGNKIGELNNGRIINHNVPGDNIELSNITNGPDGNIWFTLISVPSTPSGNKMGKISTVNGKVTLYNLPDGFSAPSGIAAGSDGNLWFIETSTNKIGEFAPGKGTFTEYPGSIGNYFTGTIVTGNDGNLWFTESTPSGNAVGKIDPANGKVTDYPIFNGKLCINGLVFGNDGNLWLTLSGFNTTNKIVKLSPITGVVTEFIVNP